MGETPRQRKSDRRPLEWADPRGLVMGGGFGNLVNNDSAPAQLASRYFSEGGDITQPAKKK